MSTVHLHIGLAKTGTTTIQSALEQCADACAEHGLHVAGGRHRAHRMAAYDLIGRRIEGDEVDAAPGAFKALVRDIDSGAADRAVVSEELLSQARSVHVRRLVRALEPHEVDVVVGVRDFARTLVSAWQQEVLMGQPFTWQEFVAAVRDPDSGGVRAGVAFWMRHDLLRVLDVWERHVPRERIQVLVVPPAGSAQSMLLDRFGTAVGLPPGVLELNAPPENTSLGAAELEVVRRLNTRVADSLTQRQHLHLVKQGIRAGLDLPSSRPLRLPGDDLGWVRERSDELIAHLRERGHRVVGDLDELMPSEAPGDAVRRLDDVTAVELHEATEAALTSLSLAHGRLFKRYRRALVEQRGEEPGPIELVRSRARAAGFRARESALERADTNPVLAWAARLYLRRTRS